jgi:hypothetical protein
VTADWYREFRQAREATEEGRREVYLSDRMRHEMHGKDARERDWCARMADHYGRDHTRLSDREVREYQAGRRAAHEREWKERSR